MPADTPCFEARNLTRAFGHGARRKVAVDDATFTIAEREIVSLVGQSGCGKSVLAKLLLRLEKPSSGELLYQGRPIAESGDPRAYWRHVQAVFQDPYAAFNQFFTIRAQLKACFRLFDQRPPEREMELDGKYPFELSGGQMQRLLLARIFILRPRVLIADEPTSMVDACSRAGILEYLMKLKQELSMTIVFVTHDIGLAYYVSDRLFILHEGRIVEQGTPDDVTQRPTSPFTRQLLDDIPSVHRPWVSRA
jgi:peptide/nickel transport system ATP-binding protein